MSFIYTIGFLIILFIFFPILFIGLFSGIIIFIIVSLSFLVCLFLELFVMDFTTFGQFVTLESHIDFLDRFVRLLWKSSLYPNLSHFY